MKKIITIFIVFLIFNLSVTCYLVVQLKKLEGRLWYDDSRIFYLEGSSAGIKEALKRNVASRVEEIFLKAQVYRSSSCAYIINNFGAVFKSMISIGGSKTWLDQNTQLYGTDNEFFTFSFGELKNKYISSQVKLGAIKRIEQCLLDWSVQDHF